jgi:predicted transcriptional regulator
MDVMKRITITIPDELVREADERSRALERSRSWVIVDALRRYLAGESADSRQDSEVTSVASSVAEGSQNRYSSQRAIGLGPYRLAQLEADLRLSVEQRVKESERAARVTELRTTPLRSERILTFDRYEDFLEWERWEELTR